jgi:hypothetical protein
MTRTKLTPHQKAARKRERWREKMELFQIYQAKFGLINGFTYSPHNVLLLRRALATGKDQPELKAMRRRTSRSEGSSLQDRTHGAS